MKKGVLISAVVFVLLITVWFVLAPVGQAQSPRSSWLNVRMATGYVHIFPSSSSYAQHQRQSPTDNSSYVNYYGGPVMLTSTTYAIYWAPLRHPITATYQMINNRYFNDVGGLFLYGILLQYYQQPPELLSRTSRALVDPTFTQRRIRMRERSLTH